MFEAWRVDLNGPQGVQIRRLLGKSYFMIAEPWPGFVCRWHRLERAGYTNPKALPPANGIAQLGAGEPMPCEHACSLWPEGVSIKMLVRHELPLHVLPDGRRVLFVPDEESYGPILPHLWRELLASSKHSRGPLVSHAYDVALGILQFWKKIVPQIVERRTKRQALTKAGHSTWEFNVQVDPSGRDQMIEDWVFFWARNLHDKPEEKFTPYLEARAIVTRATGIARETVGTIVGRR